MLDYSQKLNEFLGYGRTPHPSLTSLEDSAPEIFSTASDIIDQLIAIDEKLTAATADSMATKIGELEVDFKTHVEHLKNEGSRLLATLASLVDVPVRFDKYNPLKKSHGSKKSVVSYW